MIKRLKFWIPVFFLLVCHLQQATGQESVYEELDTSLTARQVRMMYAYMIDAILMGDKSIICNTAEIDKKRDSVLIHTAYFSDIMISSLFGRRKHRFTVDTVLPFEMSKRDWEGLTTQLAIGLCKEEADTLCLEDQFANSRMHIRFSRVFAYLFFSRTPDKGWYIYAEWYSRNRRTSDATKLQKHHRFFTFKRTISGVIKAEFL